MKKITVLLILFVGLFAQDRLKFSEFRLAGLNPEDAEPGVYIALSSGALFDANLGYQLEVAYFSKTYRKQTRVFDEDDKTTVVSTLFEESTTYIPVMAKFNYVKEFTDLFLFKADLGIGYGFLWNSEENFQPGYKNSDSRFFSGFMWQLGADIGLQISTTGSVYGGLFYNGGSLSGDYRELNGLPTFTEKDMSGVGYRITVRIDGLGLF